MAMDSTLKLDPSCVFFNDSVLSYTSMGPPTLSTDLGSPSHLFVERPSTAPAQISPGCGEVHEDPHKRRFPGPGYYELPSPDCVSQFPHRPASPHYSLASPRSRRAPPVGTPCGIMTQLRRHRVDGVGRLSFGFHTGRAPAEGQAAAPAALPGLARPRLDPALPALVRPHVDGPRAQDVPLAAAGAPGRLLGRQPALEAREAARLLWPRHVDGCVEINLCVGCTDNSSLSHFSAMTRPTWLGRAARNRHRHAIEQMLRRWRGGRRDDSARTRRKILISTQVDGAARQGIQVPAGETPRRAPRLGPPARGLARLVTFPFVTPRAKGTLLSNH
jgi:hypothetical protein